MRLVDTVVIGQGLAGTAVAWTLSKYEIDFLIIDDGDQTSSSHIAAGLVTPITGARHVQSWAWEAAYPIATDFYKYCERTTCKRFWKVEPSLRFFASQDELGRFESRYGTNESQIAMKHLSTSPWIGSSEEYQSEIARNDLSAVVHAPWGGFVMPDAARLFTSEYLLASRDYFQSRNRLRLGRLSPSSDIISEIIIEADKIVIKSMDLHCKKIIFCEGHSARTNPWFQPMELVPAQGDILTVRIPGLKLDRVLHGGLWIAPLGLESGGDDWLFQVGSTYRWTPLDGLPNPESQQILAMKLKSLIKIPFEVIDQRAAIRPAGFDHKPLIGSHPEYDRLWILNGLGAKGVLLAPWCSEILVKAMQAVDPIDVELKWNRKRKKTG